MINAVKYKTNLAYKSALNDKNILQTHEPFRIIVYDDPTPVRRDMTKISRITEVGDPTQIPTGQALLTMNCYDDSMFYDPAITQEAFKLISRYKIKVLQEITSMGGLIIEIPDNMTFSKLVSSLDKTYNEKPLFSIIEEDLIVQAESCDYYSWPYNSQWHLADIEAGEAYELLDQGGYNQFNELSQALNSLYGEWHTRDIAIIDGHGFEFTHPDLDNDEYPENHPGRFMTRKNWDCVYQNDNPIPQNINEKHGTVMAGIAASGWADRRFVRGVGLDHLNAQCLKIGYNHTTTGQFTTSSSILVRALTKAAINGNCAAIAMPFKQGYFSLFVNRVLESIRLTGRSGKGLLIFAAAGNNNLSSLSGIYPAAYADVLAIGASTPTHYRAPFSNYGTKLFATAPGTSIFAIDRCCGRGYNPGADPSFGSVTYFTGTSAATVIAASIAATMVVAYPNITAVAIKTILEITARRLGPYNYVSTSNQIGFDTSVSLETGNGILTQANAIQKVLDFAERDQAHLINYSITSFNWTWRECNGCSAETSQPIPAGTYLRGYVYLTITNDSPDPIAMSQYIPGSISVTLEDNGPEPIESTPMLPVANSGFSVITGDFVVEPGQTVAKQARWQNFAGGVPCCLNGTYYLVAKIDSSDLIAETSEEDNIAYQQVQFAYDQTYTPAYCNIPEVHLNPNPNLMISNLQVNNTTVANIVTSSSYYWEITATFTNLGNTPIEYFQVEYGWNPSIFDPGYYFNNYLMYSGTQYPTVFPFPESVAINPIMPGASHTYTGYLPYPPINYPAILTGLVRIVNGFPVAPSSMTVTQSVIIYGE